MATTTRILSASVNGTVYTTNANGALEAIDTCHSGATAPTNELANGKFWLDTTATPGTLKIYNNSAWEVVLTATGASQTKLDGIEALADVTDVTNVTAAGALMDSELTSIASVKALNQGVATTDSPTFSGVTVDNTNPTIISADADGFLTLSGGTTGTVGTQIRLYAESHATAANDITFRSGNSAVLIYNSSTPVWNFQAEDIKTTGTVTATSYAGDGSALTSLTSGNLTGALPAIDGSSLTGIAAGATGGGLDDIFYENGQNVTTNYTITNGKNAMSAGPITINSGVTVTVGAGETWAVV